MEAELEEESAVLLAAVDTQLCAQRQVCNGLSGDAHRAMDTANTGGAASAGSPGPSADVIAAARCAWTLSWPSGHQYCRGAHYRRLLLLLHNFLCVCGEASTIFCHILAAQHK